MFVGEILAFRENNDCILNMVSGSSSFELGIHPSSMLWRGYLVRIVTSTFLLIELAPLSMPALFHVGLEFTELGSENRGTFNCLVLGSAWFPDPFC